VLYAKTNHWIDGGKSRTYSLQHSGLKSLPGFNYPPVTACQKVFKTTGTECSAFVQASEFDGGSMDYECETLSFSADHPGPYPLGTTEITLTATDPVFNTGMCKTTVTVEKTSTTACQPDVLIYEGERGAWQKDWAGYNKDGYYICGAEMRYEPKQGWLGDDTAANGLRVTYCMLDNWRSQIPNVLIHAGLWGEWRGMKMCPEDHYVSGAQVRYKDKKSSIDDTALNGLRIQCQSCLDSTSTSWVTVYDGRWGSWKPEVTRSGMFVKLVKIQFQDSQDRGDDTAWNGLRFLYEAPEPRPTPMPLPTSDPDAPEEVTIYYGNQGS